MQGLTGAQAINETFRYGGKAGRTSAIVNQAFLGQHPHDLSDLIRAQRDLFTKLASTDGALSDLITNFNVTAGGVRLGVRQPLGLDQRARPHPPGGGALAAPPERRAAVGPQAGARVAAGHPRASGDDPRRLAVARAGGQAAEGAASWAAPPGCSPRRRRASPGPATPRWSLFPQVGSFSRCVSENLVPAGNVADRQRGRLPVQPPASRTSASSSTASPSSPARARASTATGRSFASRPAAVLSSWGWPTPWAEPAGPTIPNTTLFAQNIDAPHRAPAPGFRRGPRGGHPAAVPDGRSLPHPGVPEINDAAARLGPPSPEAVP